MIMTSKALDGAEPGGHGSDVLRAYRARVLQAAAGTGEASAPGSSPAGSVGALDGIYPKTPRDPKGMARALDAICGRARISQGLLSVRDLEKRLDEIYEIAHHASAVPVDYVDPCTTEAPKPASDYDAGLSTAERIVRCLGLHYSRRGQDEIASAVYDAADHVGSAIFTHPQQHPCTDYPRIDSDERRLVLEYMRARVERHRVRGEACKEDNDAALLHAFARTVLENLIDEIDAGRHAYGGAPRPETATARAPGKDKP